MIGKGCVLSGNGLTKQSTNAHLLLFQLIVHKFDHHIVFHVQQVCNLLADPGPDSVQLHLGHVNSLVQTIAEAQLFQELLFLVAEPRVLLLGGSLEGESMDEYTGYGYSTSTLTVNIILAKLFR